MMHIRLVPVLLLALLCLTPGSVQAKEVQTSTVKELVKARHSWDGTPLPAYPAGKAEITLLRITIPPGARLPLHRHPLINAGVLVHGQLTVVTRDGKMLHLKAGDPIIEVVDTWHYGKNEGADPAEIIVFYAGSPDQPLSIKKDR
ncbi:MAG: cupin domain-containing protein [Desulfoprunum sp.]|jgi:quercetin dioxygenase-like cupin family protein|uniref:cupin domain-containing protein n=1 Tax=Desulfoprunum sp. TaxID=2020866 RepID=UPI00052C8F7F|nr:cupin [Desulfobulbus sp. Tol-SR]